MSPIRLSIFKEKKGKRKCALAIGYWLLAIGCWNLNFKEIRVYPRSKIRVIRVLKKLHRESRGSTELHRENLARTDDYRKGKEKKKKPASWSVGICYLDFDFYYLDFKEIRVYPRSKIRVIRVLSRSPQIAPNHTD